MTKTILGSTLMVAAMVLGAGPARAGETIDTATVLVKLHQSDEKEIAMGKLAQKDGKSAEAKSFGKTLVKDHTAADKKVLKLAKEEKIDLGSTPDVDFAGAVAKMAAEPDFDAHFARMMLDDHEKDLASVKSDRDATSDDKLKKLLTDIVPVLEKHRDIAQKLVDSPIKTAGRE
jgi:putative membrane protein